MIAAVDGVTRENHQITVSEIAVEMEISVVTAPGDNAVAQLVEAVRYKPERRRFDSRWCHWNFSLT
jgi:hypothetical protein